MAVGVRRHIHAPQQRTDPPAQRVASIRAVAARKPHTIGWTELENADQVAAVNALDGYATSWALPVQRGLVPPQDFAPISWRTDVFELVSADVVKACDGKALISPARYAHRAVLRDLRTGEQTARVQLHFPAHRDTLDRQSKDVREYVLAAHGECVQAFHRLMTKGSLPTIGSCDANTTRLADMLADLGGGVKLAQTGPTHGDRRIDYVATRGVTLDTVRVRKIGHSDHRSVIAAYTVQSTTPKPPPEEPTVPGPYDLTTYDGRRVDWITRAALQEAARRLGYDLTLAQGSYNAGKVGASAGTHDGGGVVDLAPYDHERKVRVLREIGFAAWYRPAIRGLWGSHIHAVLMGNAKLSPSAARQVTEYLAGGDGLKGTAPDDGPRDYVNNRFHWDPDNLGDDMPLNDTDLSKLKTMVADATKGALTLDTPVTVNRGGTERQVPLGKLLAEIEDEVDGLAKQRRLMAVEAKLDQVLALLTPPAP